MDCLKCKICHFPYDDADHRPRSAHCGHELCTACLGNLINDGIFQCPKCGKKNVVNVPDDLPVCFALIDVIKAFKTEIEDFEELLSGASNDDEGGDRCLRHHVCYCVNCVNSKKEKHIKEMSKMLESFKENVTHVSAMIQDHTDKKEKTLGMAKKHGEEIEKLRSLLEQGTINKGKLEKKGNNLNEATSPHGIMECIQVAVDLEQSMQTWLDNTMGSLASLIRVLKDGKNVYVEKVIKEETRYSKLSVHEGKLYAPHFRVQPVEDSWTCMPFDQLQMMIPAEATLVFMELSVNGIVKGRVLVRLDKNLPNIRTNIVHIVTGQCGSSLAGTTFNGKDSDEINATELTLSEITVVKDTSGSTSGTRGDVIGDFEPGYMKFLRFFVAHPPKTFEYGSDCRVFGKIEDSMDVLQECYDNYSEGSVKITDCGLVIEQE